MAKGVSKTFTSTLNKNGFNYWIILLTAVIFFSVLSFYTFMFSSFEYFFGKEEREKADVYATLLFFVFWMSLLLFLYLVLQNYGLLETVDTKMEKIIVNDP